MINMKCSKIKIWFVIGMLPVGGAERTLVDLANNLDKEEFEVTVWTIKDEGELIKELSENVEYRTLDASGKWDIRAPIKFIYKLQLERPDIVNSLLFFDNLLVRIAGLLVKEPLIITGVRAVPNDKSLYRSFLDKTTQSWSDIIISNSEAGAKYVISRGASPEKVQVIRNGRDMNQYSNGYASDALYDSLSLDSTIPIVGTVGRLIERKGHYDLLDAWPSVLESHPKVQLLLVGDGPEQEGLEDRAQKLGCRDSVVFAGQRDDVSDLLDAMDVFVFPSHYEGLPGALIEAMAAGLPIVCTPVDGNAELIQGGESGIYVSPESPTELESAICNLLEDSTERERLAANARKRVEQNFSISAMVNEFESLYQKITIDS